MQKILRTCRMYKLLEARKEDSFTISLAGSLLNMETAVAPVLEFIKTNFPGFTEHGIQHSLRIIDYINDILSDDFKDRLTDVEIFCFIMSALFHDIGMTLTDIEDKEKQRSCHHLYAREPIIQYCEKYLGMYSEHRRIRDCVVFVCEAHGRDIEELYSDETFRKNDTIQGQRLRYGLLAVLLRTGDLMDLEEGRTSEFNMHLNPSYYQNKISIEHHERHLELTKYNYSPEGIEVGVKTSNRERYKIWNAWLKYLDNEIMYANTHYFQSIGTHDIKKLRLPGLSFEIKPDPGANFLVEEIRFQLDEEGALWDILTKNIYTNQTDYIRELIQNAIDAVLLKYYSDESNVLEFASPRSWGVKDRVYVLYSAEKGLLYVSDTGIGMSEEGIKNYLFKAASSGYKLKRGRSSFAFPAIAKFGIGFASCLTKADKIEISSQKTGEKKIKAEIEGKSTIAFIERHPESDITGTTVKLEVKNRFSFKELEEYLILTFRYPSVPIAVIDLDSLYRLDKSLCLLPRGRQDDYSIENILTVIQEYENSEILRKSTIHKYQLDKRLLEKIIIEKQEDRKKSMLPGKIKLLTEAADPEGIIYARREEFIRLAEKAAQNDDVQLSKLIFNVKGEIELYMSQYPSFTFPIDNGRIMDIVDYELQCVKINNNFNTESIQKNRLDQKCKGSGILFIKTRIDKPESGIEWQAVNAFLFHRGELVKSLVKVYSDPDEENSRDGILGLEQLEDLEYETKLSYETEDSEDYYKSMTWQPYTYSQDYSAQDYESRDYTFNIIYCDENEFQILYNVSLYDFENSYPLPEISNNSFRFFQNDLISDNYAGEDLHIRKPVLYQDGILLNINPQVILPLGIGWSVCNLTADAQFDLNASRHELNMNIDAIESWMDRTGRIIQEETARHCIDVLQKIQLDFTVSSLIQTIEDDSYLARSGLRSMKEVLNRLI